MTDAVWAPYAFISYAHSDSESVLEEIRQIRAMGHSVWYDDGITPGSEWTDSLAQHIEGCALFVFLVTPRSVASENCRRELAFALERGRAVLAIHLEDTSLPGAVGLSLGNRQAILKYRMLPGQYEARLARTLAEAMGDHEVPTAPEPVALPAPYATSGNTNRYWSVGGWLAAAAVAFAAGGWWVTQVGDRPASNASVTRTAIAVLPFDNLSGDPDQEYFSDGIAEDILNDLARSSDLLVRPRGSSFRFRTTDLDSRGIGEQLQVTHLVEGSTRKAGDQVRVNIQLIDVAANATLWSARYDRQLVDILQVQDEITARISAELNAQLVGRERSTTSPEAYEALLRARYHYARAQSDIAHQWYTRATHLDPHSADAWAELAWLEYHVDNAPHVPALLANTRKATRMALENDPEHSGARAVRWLTTVYVDRNYQEALDALFQLVRESPSSTVALRTLAAAFTAVRRYDLAVQVHGNLVDLDPLSLLARGTYAAALLNAGEINAARDAVRDMDALVGPGGASLRYVHIDLALAEGNPEQVLAEVARGRATNGDNSFYYLRAALAHRLLGNAEASRQLIAELRRSGAPSPVSERFSGLASWDEVEAALVGGEIDAALVHFREALRRGEPKAFVGWNGGVHAFRVLFPDFYQHPHYFEILAEFGLDAASLSKLSIPDLPLGQP